MPYSCAAYGCKNTTDICKVKNISFHGFPVKNGKLLKVWLLKLRRKDFIPSRHSKLCSEHFQEKDFINHAIRRKRYLKADAVPSKFIFDQNCPGRKLIASEFYDPSKPLSEDAKPLRIKLIDLRAKANAVPVLLNVYSNLTPETDASSVKLKNRSVTEFPVSNMNSDKSSALSSKVPVSDGFEINSMNTRDFVVPSSSSDSSDLQFQLKFVNKLPDSGSFKVERISDDYTMCAVTGLSLNMFHSLFKLLCLEDLLTKDCQLSPLDQFFLMTLYLKTGISQHCLAFLYKIKQSTVSRTIINTAIIVCDKLKKLDTWPSKKIVQKETPLSFSKMFPNCRIIIDSVEFPIQNPFNTITQEETLNRKNIYTMKGLIGITPYGKVSFISDLVGGAISDKDLVLSSGLLDFLEPGDLVMSDKGFPIKQELAVRGCELVTPRFCDSKYNSCENGEFATMSHYHALVEKTISRIKTFKYFDGQITNRGLQYSSKYFHIITFFSNYAYPINPEENVG